MKKLVIGIPSRGDDINTGLMQFILKTITTSPYHVTIATSKSNVSAVESVNFLWEMIKKKLGNFDYYMQIDTDVVPPDNALASMIALDKDIVVAPIWHYDEVTRDIHINIHPSNLRERCYTIKTAGSNKIYASSLGCILMKHKVIETFVKANEHPIMWSALLGEYKGVDGHNDNIFFAKAAKLGLEAWVDWSLTGVKHYKRIELSTEVLNHFVEVLHKMREMEDKLEDRTVG